MQPDGHIEALDLCHSFYKMHFTKVPVCNDVELE